MEPAVHLRGAVALIGRFPALAGADLDVARGEIVLLQGANGAGKTSLLRACAGLLPIVDGDAIILGHDLRTERTSVRPQVGLLGHSTALYDDLSVSDNVRFWTRAAKGDQRNGDAAMARLGLADRLSDVPVGRLSAGQRRRVSFAVLLARRPELWLLDEPHAGLDQEARDEVDGLVHDAAAAGATVLVASHELDRAQALAQRTVHVAGGHVTDGAAPSSTDGPAPSSTDGPAPIQADGAERAS
jgi:heme ABC exporter ATP-binding subunit CcmA